MLTNKERLIENILKLQNITKEVDTLPDYVDTSDATATAEDIKKDKTVYINGEKVTGNYTPEVIESSVVTNGMKFGESSVVPEVLDTSNVTDMSRMFYGCTKLTKVPMMDMSKVTDASYMFYNNYLITTIPNLDTSNVNLMNNMFQNCKGLLGELTLDASSASTLDTTFSGCNNIQKIILLNSRNVKIVTSLFTNCQKLEEVSIDTSSVSGFTSMFTNCYKLTTVPLLNGGKVQGVDRMFYNCESLTNFGGIKDLGKAYNSKNTHYSIYTLDLVSSTKLTHDSLMNVINNLYDLNISYKVADGEKLYRQYLKLGATNIAKLTEEEIAIATDKGWDVT